jgi:predicted Zn-dependent protease
VAGEGGAQLIEVGWVLAGELDTFEREAVDLARRRLLAQLEVALPEFTWRMPVIHRRRLVQEPKVEPVVLLELAASEREARRWDFAVVVTDAELSAYYTAFAHGMPARALGAAVLSTAYLEPSLVEGREAPDAQLRLVQRIERLVLHLFGHLNGLGHREERRSTMCEIGTVADLDLMEGYLEEDLAELREELLRVGDARLEEAPGTPPRGALAFHLLVAWHNRHEVLSGLRQMAPWRFPLRFSRLTIAALSSLLIVIITAESWELGMRQSPLFVAGLAATVVLGSSAFVVQRQQLLARRPSKRLSEQRAVTNLTLTAAVVLGLITTWLVLFLFILLLGGLLFRPDVVEHWAPSLQGRPTFGDYCVFSGFAASFGLVFGALGASFEGRNYFRHVAYVDRET